MAEARIDGAPPETPMEEPEPEWEVARLFPPRGHWTEEEYLALPTNRRVELSDGCLEILPMPSEFHQFLVAFLYEALVAFVRPRGLGSALFAGLPVQLWTGKMREPDVVFLRAGQGHRRKGAYWEGADLVMEVVSPGQNARERDLATKRNEYARAGIREYWIVDPEGRTVTILVLELQEYRVHATCGEPDLAASVLLPGFAVSVADLFGFAAASLTE